MKGVVRVAARQLAAAVRYGSVSGTYRQCNICSPSGALFNPVRWSSSTSNAAPTWHSRPRQPAKLDVATGMTAPYNIFFCGTDLFAVRILQRLHETKSICDKLVVLVPPDQTNKFNGKPVIEPVKKYALQHNLPLLVKPKVVDGGWASLKVPAPFAKMDPRSLLIVASFGYLIPPRLRARFHDSNTLNVHPSLLPQLRGAAPIEWAIAHQHTQTGVSIQTLGPEFDSGAIVAQQSTDMEPGVRLPELREHLGKLSSDLLVETLQSLPERAGQAWRQDTKDDNGSTLPGLVLAPKWDIEHARVDWDTMDPDTIVARQRAFGYKKKSWTLGLFYKKTPQRVLLDDISVVPFDEEHTSKHTRMFLPTAIPGQFIYDDRKQCFLVRGRLESGRKQRPSLESPDPPTELLCVKTLWVEGKKPTSAREWVEGYKQTRLFHLPGIFANKKKYPIWQFGK